MDAKLLYNELMDEIRADEMALDEKRDLARLLKKRLDAMRQPADTAIAVPVGQVSVAAEAPAATSLVQHVEQALPMLGAHEFVVGDVAAALRARGVPLPEKPNPKITTVLARLQATGVLARTFTGAGNVPNRYKNADPRLVMTVRKELAAA